jgi:hypothetical protein
MFQTFMDNLASFLNEDSDEAAHVKRDDAARDS